jgi:cytochrome P450
MTVVPRTTGRSWCASVFRMRVRKSGRQRAGKAESFFSHLVRRILVDRSLRLAGKQAEESARGESQTARNFTEDGNGLQGENPPGSPGANSGMMERLCYGVDDDGKPLSESQLIVNIVFILFASHNTTTKGSFCAFAYHLTEYREIKRLLVAEAQTFSEPLDVEQLKAAPLLNVFLTETW